MPDDLPVALTIDEACRQLVIGRTMLFRMRRAGLIRSVAIGGVIRIPRSEVHRLLAENTPTVPRGPSGDAA